MGKTLAQKAADRALKEAVGRVVESYALLPPGHNMIDFVVVVEGMNITAEDEHGDMPESVGVAFRDGVCRTSVARGLLGAGYDMMRVQQPVDMTEGNDGEA